MKEMFSPELSPDPYKEEASFVDQAVSEHKRAKFNLAPNADIGAIMDAERYWFEGIENLSPEEKDVEIKGYHKEMRGVEQKASLEFDRLDRERDRLVAYGSLTRGASIEDVKRFLDKDSQKEASAEEIPQAQGKTKKIKHPYSGIEIEIEDKDSA